MPSAYIEALKEWNKGKPKWTIPRKQSPEYAEVIKIKERLGAKNSKSSSRSSSTSAVKDVKDVKDTVKEVKAKRERKTKKAPVCMSLEEAIKEHKRLVKVLAEDKPAEVKKELVEQTKELKKMPTKKK